MEMLSPGVYSQLIDKSQVVPTVGTSTTVFGGVFNKGPIGAYTLISDRNELVDFYGKPDASNYNDFFQAYTFLGYSNNLLISRAGNLNGKHTPLDGVQLVTVGVVEYRDTGLDDDPTTLSVDEGKERFMNYQKVQVTRVDLLKVQDIISFGDIDKRYMITDIDAQKNILTLSREIVEEFRPRAGDTVNSVEILFNGSNEVLDITKQEEVQKSSNNETRNYLVPGSLTQDALFETNVQVPNKDVFDEKFDGITFSSPKSKIKFIAQNPGSWCKNIKIAIAKPDDFLANDFNDDHVTKYAFPGLVIDDLFEYAPKGSQIGVIIYDEEKQDIVETYTVDFNPSAVDDNNKSTFIESVINRQSEYVYVKVNEENTEEVSSYTYVYDEGTESYVGKSLTLRNYSDSSIQRDDLLDAYEVFGNKEELEVDIIIANELDNGASARNLLSLRGDSVSEPDCICVIGAPREILVGKKSADCTKNLVNFRMHTLNVNDKYCALFGNYLYVYDRYNDKYRWINCAGTVAGKRAQVNQRYAPWYASAGLERGVLDTSVTKLAFNPNKSQRDMLYKNAINPIVTFPAEGTVIWGQKTLQAEASSFDRINIVCLFNTIIRSLTKASRHSVFEFNDTYTRNNVLAQMKPFLTNVKTQRGIQDFLVVCDESNNTDEVISHNQFIVDIYIKPTYTAEFLLLRFTNVGTRSFAEVVSA
jgi:hypothetical protein